MATRADKAFAAHRAAQAKSHRIHSSPTASATDRRAAERTVETTFKAFTRAVDAEAPR